MAQLQELLANAAKLEELELQIPELQIRQKELQENLARQKEERDWARLEAKNLEEPGFFLRLFGKAEQKREKAQEEARQAAAAYEHTKREVENLEYQMDILQKNCDALSGSREAYELARTEYLAGADGAAQQLREWEIDAFRPVAIETVRKIRQALYAARGWMQKEIQNRYYNRETRRMACFQMADEYAEKLQSLTKYFPEGKVTLGASMSSPHAYIREVSTNLSQVDRLNIAIEQSLRVQEQLESL